MRKPILDPLRSLRAALLTLAAAAVVSCGGSSTDPGGGGGEVEITYSPLAATFTMVVGGSRELRATVTGTDQAVVTWTVRGATVGTGQVYTHVPTAVGKDTISVAVQAGSETGGRQWYATIEPDITQLPPLVSGVAVSHGELPTEVVVSWLRVTPTVYPIADYLVVCSYDGPVNAANWDQATPLGAFPHNPGTVQHRAEFGPADGMVGGAQAWFAVRARDDRGQLSPLLDSYALTISYPWTLDVEVRDDAGAPLQNVILNYGGPVPLTTDAAGRASIGPLRSIDEVTVATTSGHFDYTTAPLAVSADTLHIVLLRKYALDHVPCGTTDYADFLQYFRAATATTGVGDRATVLHRWEQYPLSVWIPAVTSPTLAWDLQTLAAAAVPIWNDALGEDFLVAAADSVSADIVFSFLPLPGYNGFTRVLLPGGILGAAIPRKIRVEVELNLDGAPGTAQPIWVTEVALHELGHALGHYGHLCDSGRGNLMDWGGAIGSLADGPENAICLDEARAVRAVRTMPQGTDLANYGAR